MFDFNQPVDDIGYSFSMKFFSRNFFGELRWFFMVRRSELE